MKDGKTRTSLKVFNILGQDTSFRFDYNNNNVCFML